MAIVWCETRLLVLTDNHFLPRKPVLTIIQAQVELGKSLG